MMFKLEARSASSFCCLVLKFMPELTGSELTGSEQISPGLIGSELIGTELTGPGLIGSVQASPLEPDPLAWSSRPSEVVD
jgi:hypothetical protein